MVLQIDLFVFQHCSQQKCRVHLSTNYGIPEVALLALLSPLPSFLLVISLIVIGKKLSLQSSVWRFILLSLSLFFYLSSLWLHAALSGFQLITFRLHLVINNVTAGGKASRGRRMTRSWPRASCLSKGCKVCAKN